jgi:hypothetical protein
MTTNANGNGSLTPESASDSRVQDSQDDDWEGLKKARNRTTRPNAGGNSTMDSVDTAFTGLGILLFIACWIVFGIIIFHALTSMGIFIVFAVLGGIIGGFIATVITWIIGMAGGI